MNNDSRFNLEYENSNIFFPEISSGQTILHNLNIFDFVTLNFNSFSLSIFTTPIRLDFTFKGMYLYYTTV